MARQLVGVWRVLIRRLPVGGRGLRLESNDGFLLLEGGNFLLMEG